MPERTEPIAGTYSLTESAGANLRVRYLACYLSEPAAAAVTTDSLAIEAFERALLSDECYKRVAASSKMGTISGQPPVLSQP
jgi:D-alanyl-D-alanine dipeptidase